MQIHVTTVEEPAHATRPIREDEPEDVGKRGERALRMDEADDRRRAEEHDPDNHADGDADHQLHPPIAGELKTGLLCVGVWWTIRAFLIKAAVSTWWLELVAGVLMLAMAFWTSGQFFIEKAYTLLVFAGIWALMHGVIDIVGAFRIRGLRRLV
jgi:hypothetical protein